MADSDQAIGSLGITQRWKEFVSGFHARLFGAMLYTPNGDSLADDTADAVKTVGVAGTAVIGKARLVTATGDEITDDTADAVKAKLSANSGVDIGDVDVLSIAAGDNNIGNVDIATIAAGDTNIGNVDIVTLPAANLGQRAMAASLSTVPASDIADATYIGDIKFGEALPAGTALLGKVGIDQTTPGTTNNVQLTEGAVDDGAVTLGTQRVIPMGMLADETDPDSVDEGDIGVPRMTLSRIPWAAMRAKNAASADKELICRSAGQLQVDVELISGNGVNTSDGNSDGQAAGSGGMVVPARPFGFNGTTWDRLRSIAASGAGLGVQQVGTLGELITLAASAARTSDANGTAVTGLGWRNRYIILFDLTVADTDAGDTLDVYVDVSLDGNTWLNAVHFTQIIGTDAASKRYAVLDPSAPGTAEILVTSDAAAGVVRPSMFGAQMRARWAIVDAGTDDASFTFSISAYAI